MPLTNDDLSVWELAHRLAESDPYKRYWLGLPLSVKDNIRLLLNEILSYRLTTNLIMEQRRQDSDMPSEYFIRHYLDEIYDCVYGHSYPKRLLRFISVDRWDFWQWCQQTEYQPPEFWFSVEYQETDEEAEEKAAQSVGLPEKVSPREDTRKTRQQCRTFARERWGDDPTIRIAEMARLIRSQGVAQHVTDRTVETYIRRMAPESIRNRSGRSRKT